MTIAEQLSAELLARREQALYRRRRTVGGAQGVQITVDGERLLNFCSNDYLGLAGDPRLGDAMRTAISTVGVGSGASHLLGGHNQEHHELEDELAVFTGRERALLFSTGYMANVGVISALVKRGDLILEDRLNHASLLDGGISSGAKFQRYRHGDVRDAEQRLVSASSLRRRLLVTDGVFSMDGDTAPLKDLAAIAQQQQAWLMVDDAHGFGVLGKGGRGTPDALGLSSAQVPIYMGTLGKAAGSFGAFVAGDEILIESLIQFARPYIYTTAMPPAVAAATRASLRIIREEHWRRQRLQEHIRYFRHEAERIGLALLPSTTPIQPVLVGDADLSLTYSAELEKRGLWVAPVRSPTVPAGSARLRVTFSAQHHVDHIDRLLSALEAVCCQ